MIAKITGIPQSQLSFPFYAYIPFGWLIIGGVSRSLWARAMSAYPLLPAAVQRCPMGETFFDKIPQ